MPYRSPVVAGAQKAKVVIGITLFAPFIIAGLVIAVPLALIAPLLPKRKMTAQEVAKAIRDFLDDIGGEWDWDDFTSGGPVADPRLDAIVQRAGAVPLPVDDIGACELRALLAEAEALDRAGA